MARKKAEPKKTAKPNNNAYIEGAGLVADEKITMSLEKDYMPICHERFGIKSVP